MPEIDLRSDTVTKPSPGMRAAMAAADVGDDVYGEDPTVNRLQAECADRLGFEAGLFLASGTQSNLAALLAHCRRGDEYIAGQEAHAYRFEGGGAAALGGIVPQPLPFQADGTLSLSAVEAAIKPEDDHFARTRLVCLENTQAGQPIAAPYFRDARALADRHRLGLHLDGARLFNAAVALATTPSAIARSCHSASVCLSKGLGAPAGSVLCGDSEFVAAARRWRKVLGGGMRQAGVLAAAGLYALAHNVSRLAEDHDRAAQLAAGLRDLGVAATQRTNMVFVDDGTALALVVPLRREGISVVGSRWVLHQDIGDGDVAQVLDSVDRALGTVDLAERLPDEARDGSRETGDERPGDQGSRP